MKPVIMGVPGAVDTHALAANLGAEVGQYELRTFPDGEYYVRINTPLEGRDVVLVCSLVQPRDKLLPLLFLAGTARDLGARRVGLVAPYLAFMRQDTRFHPGEGITSVYFASLISHSFDWLVCVDPHLHRWRSLDQIYSIPAHAVHAAPCIATWIQDNVSNPILIGPDAESEQWVASVARLADAPYLVLDKIRHGDRDVEVSVPDPERCRGRNPVLIDDIISTARTMIEPVEHFGKAGLPAPICIGIHAVFVDTALADLMAAGAARVITCNTIAHETNAIFIDELLAESVRAQLVRGH